MSYFENVPQVKYEGKTSKNPFAFKFYNPDEVILGKKMKDHLRFAMAYWHTMNADGTDPFGSGTLDRTFGKDDPMERAYAKVDAAFDLMTKLGIEYFCFHDVDIAPQGNSLEEFKKNLSDITDYIKTKMDATGIKLLWGTANVFSNPRYMSGAGTSPNVDSFVCAAAQIKNAIDATIKLGGQGYVFWGGREGYDTLLNTDMDFELKNLARLLTMARNYARSKGFKGVFYIEPKPKEPTKHQYDFDAATAIGFLRANGLADDFRMNIENNHATLAMHTFQHELRTSAINGMFGSVDANQGDDMLGWDTDMFPSNVYDCTLAMYEIIKAGGFTTGGLNFDSKVRRQSYTPEDIAYAHILGMDSFALGLRAAAALLEDGRIDKFVEERYSSWKSVLGEQILGDKCTLDQLEAVAGDCWDTKVPSGREEYLQEIINSVLFSL